MFVRRATTADRATVANVLDGAALETDPDLLAASIERGTTFVAVAGDRPAGEQADGGETADARASEGAVVGALVLDGDRIVSVAVRRRRRGQGIGTALVERALVTRGRLVAKFDERVRPFYESLGFDIEPIEGCDGRCRGTGAL